MYMHTYKYMYIYTYIIRYRSLLNNWFHYYSYKLPWGKLVLFSIRLNFIYNLHL